MRETIEIDRTAYEVVEGTRERPTRLKGGDGIYLVEQWGSPTVLSLVEPSDAWREARAAEDAARVRAPDIGGFLLAMYDENLGLGEERALELARLRPDLTLAVQLGRFDVAGGLLRRITERGEISVGELDKLQELMASFAIPADRGGVSEPA
jgi:hypothetical protein